MRLFLAGIYTSNFNLSGRLFLGCTEAEQEHRRNVANILESYHYVHRDSYVRHMRRDGVRVFLDSGAFSAFTKGVEVDLPAYCDYILENQDIIEVASVLDGIGDPYQTWKNQQEMEQRGTRPLPCFHYNEPVEYLQHYIDNYDYITLGGMVPISTPQLKFWLDEIWSKYLTHPDGSPKIKVHGFGLTTLSLMERYPWYSVDSSSWVQIAAAGNIITPKFGIIAVSESSPSRKKLNQHVDNLPDLQRRGILDYIEEHGFELERLRTMYASRWAFNCWAYTEIGNNVHGGAAPHFTIQQPTLF